jgi:hypothetical protein
MKQRFSSLDVKVAELGLSNGHMLISSGYRSRALQDARSSARHEHL